jgi:hypothetical protein
MRRGIVGLLALAAVLAVSAVPAQAATPRIKVNPRTGLTYNEIVLVSGFGWVANSHVLVRECSGGVWTGDSNACGTQFLKRIEKGSHRFHMRVTVEVGPVGDGYCGTSALTRRSCAIEVVQLDNNGDPTATIALRRIAFAVG